MEFLHSFFISSIIIPFCTHGGGGFGMMIDDIKKECKNSIVKDGLALSGVYDFYELQKWIENNLYNFTCSPNPYPLYLKDISHNKPNEKEDYIQPYKPLIFYFN